MENIKKKRKVIITALIVLFALAIILGAFIIYRKRPVKGIEIFPETEWLCKNPVYYRQNDETWGRDKMGTAVDTLGGSGCLVTCLAASMEMQMGAVDAGYQMTPGQLNEAFSSHQIYDERANVLWNPLREYLADWTVETPSRPEAETIEEMLKAGQYPIVKVRMPRSGANHWVMLMEARDGEYYCMDPLHGADEMVPLSQFGNMVYGVRCVEYIGR